MTAYVKRACVPPHLVDERDPPAIALLKEDHQMLRALFDLVETAGDDILFPVAGEICIRLAIHMVVEEQLFYPSLKAVIRASEVDEAIAEHQIGKSLIADIVEMEGGEELLRARVHVLGEETVHHINRENRALFRHARQAWEEGKIDLVELGTEMRRRRRELFDLVGSVAADRRIIDLKPIGDAVREQPETRTQDGVSIKEDA